MTGGNDVRVAAIGALSTPDARKKALLAETIAKDWASGLLDRRADSRFDVPARPSRPERPILRPPKEMPKRKIGGSPEKRAAMLHALAHIELNAIDLALDMIARFDRDPLPRSFCADWTRIAGEEAEHFLLLSDRMAELDFTYGDFPAHDGLWQAAAQTAHDLLARLAIVPLVLEARGLDVTPSAITGFTALGDRRSADILQRIFNDEIGHVASGMHWFRHVAMQRGLDPVTTWHGLVKAHFRGRLKPPFNEHARSLAGMPAEFYRAN